MQNVRSKLIFKTSIKNGVFNPKIALKQLTVLTVELSKFLIIPNNKLSKIFFVHHIRGDKSFKIFILMAANS